MVRFKHYLLLLLLSLCSMVSYAYDFEVDGYYYEVDLDNMTATIVSTNGNLAGQVYVPESVSYKNREFRVTSIKGAFAGNKNITDVVMSPTVTSLGEKTFYGCSALKSITGIENISKIGASCFYGCSSLSSILLSTKLTEIGSYAFYGCVGFSQFNVPQYTSSIGESAFRNCTNLSFIKLPEKITCLEKNLFSGCTSLLSIEIPESVNEIQDNVFYGCKSIESITIPKEVKYIRTGVFGGCSNIKTVVFEDTTSKLFIEWNKETSSSYPYIRTPAFVDCKLEYVYMGRPVDSTCGDETSYMGCFAKSTVAVVELSKNTYEIEEGEFRECKNLASLVIPKTVKKIGSYAFVDSGIKSITFEDGLEDLQFDLQVPSWSVITPTAFSSTMIEYAYIGRNLITSGGAQNPNYRRNPSTFLPTTLKQLIIGDYVKNIDLLLYSNQQKTTSLSHYPNLSKLEFGAEIKKIPDLYNNAMLNTLATTSVVPPIAVAFTNAQYMDMIVEVPMGALNAYTSADIWKKFWEINENESLLRVIETNNLRYRKVTDTCLEVIGNDSKYKGDISIPEEVIYNGTSYKVVSVGEEAFAECLELTSVSIPHTVKNIENECFYGCTSLHKVQFSNGLESIGDYAFANCSSLSEIIWPETLTSVGTSAFSKCSNLLNFIGKNVISIGEYAFMECSQLQEVVLNKTISIIPSFCFRGCYKLNAIDLQSVVRIEDAAFWACHSIKNINLPVVQYIGGSAFDSCIGLETIDLGFQLEEIFTDAFANCTSLKSITIPGSVKKIWHGIISGCTSLKEIIFADGDTPLDINGTTFDTRTSVQTKQVNGTSVRFMIEYYKSTFYASQVERLYLGRNISGAPRHTIKYDTSKKYWLITSYDCPFNNLPKLKELIIGKDVDVIGPSDAYLQELDLHVTPGSFKNCAALETVTVKNPVPPLGAEFSGTTYSNAWLEVPRGTHSIYQSSEGWKEFLSIDEGNFIKTQPTKNNLCVELDIPDDDAKYQWHQYFEAENDSKPITPISSGAYYTWEENAGVWTSNNNGKNSSSAVMSATIEVQTGDKLCFDWNVSSESDYDFFIVTINGSQVLKKSDFVNGKYEKVFTSSSTVSVEFRYTKDSSGSIGSDCAYVSNLCLIRPSGFTEMVDSNIEGATASVLERSLIKKQCEVYCVVTLLNGKNLTSDRVPVNALVLGDVNDDGLVSLADLTSLAQYIAGSDTSEINMYNSDINIDGAISIADITVLIDKLRSSSESEVESGNLGGNEGTQEGDDENHKYVDLGLPSGTLWATCNVGADSPEDYGYYFAWGETEAKSTYTESTYFDNGREMYNRFSRKVLDLDDDAAYKNWGDGWRMPSRDQQAELLSECTWIWTSQNGKYGYLVKSKTNDNTIFLPAAGNRDEDSLYLAGSCGRYWSRSIDKDFSSYAFILSFNSDKATSGVVLNRSVGGSVRPVHQ